MELTEVMESRRSIRAFKPNTTVSRDALKKIVLAAQYAPSWKNSQTGRYYVVDTPEMLAKIKSECLPEFNRNNSANAPVLIVTAYEKNIAGFDTKQNPVNELGNAWGAYDLGLQNQLIVLKAKELGFDTLIMGIRSQTVLRELLNIPDSQEIAAVIAVGYRLINPNMPMRKPLYEIMKFF